MIYKIDNLTLNTVSYDVFRGDRQIELSPSEFNMLKLLMEEENVVVSRETILAKLDKKVKEDSNNVDVYISYLRRKIDNNEEKKLIKTIRDVGYKIYDKDKALSKIKK